MMEHDEQVERASSMLEWLDRAGVFSVYPDGDGFEAREECDQYFRLKLTADEVRELGQELIDLANSPR